MVRPAGKTLAESLNARVIGAGLYDKTLVLAHGFGSAQSQWHAVLPSLQDKHQLVLFDWPGSATTDLNDFDDALFCKSLYEGLADTLLSLLRELHVESCTFIGHSMSAMIGCIAALRQPSLFNKLILVGASPRYLNAPDYYGGFGGEDLEQLYEAMSRDYQGWADNFAAAVVGASAEEAVKAFKQTLSGMKQEVAVAMARAIFEGDWRSMMEQLVTERLQDDVMKVHVLQTYDDMAVPLLVSDYLKRQLGSHGSVEILQTPGHVPQLSAPSLFSSVLLRYLSS